MGPSSGLVTYLEQRRLDREKTLKKFLSGEETYLLRHQERLADRAKSRCLSSTYRPTYAEPPPKQKFHSNWLQFCGRKTKFIEETNYPRNPSKISEIKSTKLADDITKPGVGNEKGKLTRESDQQPGANGEPKQLCPKSDEKCDRSDTKKTGDVLIRKHDTHVIHSDDTADWRSGKRSHTPPKPLWPPRKNPSPINQCQDSKTYRRVQAIRAKHHNLSFSTLKELQRIKWEEALEWEDYLDLVNLYKKGIHDMRCGVHKQEARCLQVVQVKYMQILWREKAMVIDLIEDRKAECGQVEEIWEKAHVNQVRVDKEPPINIRNNKSRGSVGESLEESLENDDESESEWEYYSDEEYEDEMSLPKGDMFSPFCSTEIPIDMSLEARKAASEMTTWIKMLLDRDSDVLVKLQKKLGSTVGGGKGAKNSSQRSSHGTVIEYLGKRDRSNKYHGEGEVFYSNGTYFAGTFHHGVREGIGVLDMKNGDVVNGFYKNDKLDGWVTEMYDGTGWRQAYYRSGIQDGLYREISPCGKLLVCGRNFNGERLGRQWRLCQGGALMIGDVDNKGCYIGDNVVYLYPAFWMVILGTYQKGRLISGREGFISSLSWDECGLPLPQVKILRNSRNLSYESPGTHCPAKNLLVRDLYDILHVYVGQSTASNAGEGLFARIDIAKGSLVVLFNGVRKRKIFRTVATSDEEFSDYIIRVDENVSLDIPDYYVPVHRYSATLAHKACHSFRNNANFCHLEHPRFGGIMSIVASRDIRKGEEIFVHYGYDIQTAPYWYKNLWLQYLRRECGWSREDVDRYGISVAVSPASMESVNRIIRERNAKSKTISSDDCGWNSEDLQKYTTSEAISKLLNK